MIARSSPDPFPVAWAEPTALAAFAVLLVLIWCLPRAAAYRGAPDEAPWRDLRLWATGVVLLQMALYLWLP